MRRPSALTLTLAALVAAAALLGGCRRDDEEPVRVAIIGDTPTLLETVDRPLSEGEALVRSNMAQGLVRFDGRGQIVPGLAERWNVSDDGLSYIFRLQMGEWSDGRKIKAEDIVRIIRRQLRSANNNPIGDTLGAVSEVVAMTDKVIEIRLVAPRPNLLQLLAQPEMGLVRSGLGTGPFLTWEEGPKLAGTLALEHRVRIPDAPDIREHVLVSGGGGKTLVKTFADGDLDLVTGGTFTDLPLVQSADLPRGSLRFDPAIGLFGLVPLRKDRVFGDRDVRRLLSQAIDRSELIARLKITNLVPRATILQPGLEGIAPPAQPDWLSAKASDRSGQLAAEAKRLFGAVERPEVRILIPDGPGGDILLERLNLDWRALGITAVRAKTRASADFALVDEVAPSTSPAWFLRHFRCGASVVCIEDVEPILTAARATQNARERAALFSAVATKMDEAQLFIPIAAPVRWSLVANGHDGFVENQFARHTLVGLKNARAREAAQ